MRCCAPVTEKRLYERKWPGSVEDYEVEDSTSARCRREGRVELAWGKWFCRQHEPIWRTHYRILERIRAL